MSTRLAEIRARLAAATPVELIAHTPDDVAWLLAEVVRLEADFRSRHDGWSYALVEIGKLNDEVGATLTRLQDAHAERDALKAQLRTMLVATNEHTNACFAERDALKAKLATAVRLLNYHSCAHENADGEMCENVTEFLATLATLDAPKDV